MAATNHGYLNAIRDGSEEEKTKNKDDLIDYDVNDDVTNSSIKSGRPSMRVRFSDQILASKKDYGLDTKASSSYALINVAEIHNENNESTETGGTGDSDNMSTPKVNPSPDSVLKNGVIVHDEGPRKRTGLLGSVRKENQIYSINELAEQLNSHGHVKTQNDQFASSENVMSSSSSSENGADPPANSLRKDLESPDKTSNEQLESLKNAPKDQLESHTTTPEQQLESHINTSKDHIKSHTSTSKDHITNTSKDHIKSHTRTSKEQLESHTEEASKAPKKSPDGAWLEQFETTLRSSVDDNAYVTPEHVRNCLQAEQSFFMDRLLQLVDDKDDNQEIGVDSLMDELRAVVYGTQADKLKLLFDVYDIDGGGGIERNELHTFLTSVIDECKLSIDKESIQALGDTFFNTADKNHDGKISFDELHELFQSRLSIVNNITIRPTTNTNKDVIKKRGHFRRLSRFYIRNNARKVVSIACCTLANVVLMGVGVYLYWDSSAWVKIARATGLALNLDCTLVLVFMLRHTITYLRNTPLRHVLPFDQHTWFHGLCGYVIVLLTVGHVIGHVGNCVDTATSGNMTVGEMMFTTKAGIGWVGHAAYITGDLLIVILLVMVVLSLPAVRRSGFFEVFYWSHKLYLLFWAALILHAPHFWMWFVLPGAIFLLELLARNRWLRMFSQGKTYIEQVSLLPSGVTHLVISRPHSFEFKPGDYIFIQIPAVAKYERHPFTISSAPENKEEIWLHIRSAGHWTNSLYKHFTDYQATDPEDGEGDVTPSVAMDSGASFARLSRRRASSIAWLRKKPARARKVESVQRREVTKKVKVLVHIDGPYGTASRHIFEQERVVLIGSGIGITPFASILQSIVCRYKASCVRCPACSHRWCHQLPAFAMTLKKVDFVLINRDQRQFEWFASLLGRLEREQEVEGGLGGIVDMHMFMTSLPAETDMRGMGLQLALDLVRQDDDTDLLTGLRTRTQWGRPNFDKLFTKIKAKSEGRRIKVFFCGSPMLGKTIKLLCSKYDFGFAHESF